MKIRKTTYKIGTTEGIREQTGSVGYHFPFMVHREKGARVWRISHIATGYKIRDILYVKEARALVKQLSRFSVFLMPTIETWTKALQNLRLNNPKEYEELIKLVGCQK